MNGLVSSLPCLIDHIHVLGWGPYVQNKKCTPKLTNDSVYMLKIKMDVIFGCGGLGGAVLLEVDVHHCDTPPFHIYAQLFMS